jgi:branched-chain amino acid transport system permease protein
VSFLGNDFYIIAPYVVMILVLLVRPYGLFGSRPAERL